MVAHVDVNDLHNLRLVPLRYACMWSTRLPLTIKTFGCLPSQSTGLALIYQNGYGTLSNQCELTGQHRVVRANYGEVSKVFINVA